MEIIPLFQWPGHRDAVYALGRDVNGAVMSAGGDGNIVAWDPSNPQLPGRAMFRLNGGIYTFHAPSRAYNAWIIGGIRGEMHFFQEAAAGPEAGHSPNNARAKSQTPSSALHPPDPVSQQGPPDPASQQGSPDPASQQHLTDPASQQRTLVLPPPAQPHDDAVQQRISSDCGLVHHASSPTTLGINTGKAPIHDLQFMGQTLWSAHGDGRLLSWCLEDPFPRIANHSALSPSALRCLATHPSAPYMASGSSDGKIRISSETGEVVQEFSGHTLSVFSLLFLVGGKYLLSGSRDAHLAVWDTESGQLLDRFPAHLGTLNHLVAIPEWGCIGSAGRDKEIRLWDSKTLELRRVINREHAPQHAHTHSVNRLLWIPEKSMLLSAGDDRKIRAWQISGRT